MYENTKAAFLRRSNNRLFTNVFKGDGLHISPGNDPLKQQHYPLCKSITVAEIADSKIETDSLKQQLSNKEFDFVYATNLAFYEDEPIHVINHWLNFVTSKGHLVLTVSDEELYEKIFRSLELTLGYLVGCFDESLDELSLILNVLSHEHGLRQATTDVANHDPADLGAT
jgi:hypothetical protein